MSIDIARLSTLKSFEDLIGYLEDELEWDFRGYAPEEVVFEYLPTEVGLKEEDAEKVSIRQLRPIEPGQPWGIFYLNFAGRLSIQVLRGILRGLVAKKRASANRSEMRKWQTENLLFICTSNNFQKFNFAYFRGKDTNRAVLSTFGWQQGDTHLRTLAQYNLPALRFPDNTNDTEGWLKKWREAFDVEAVTAKFFSDYRKVFESVEDEVKASIQDAETVRLYTQRLFNRLMFLYFIQKKGWLEFEGNKNYLRALFNTAENQKENFLRERLYYVFFWGMSNVGESREAHTLEALRQKRGNVPYLNGGLFDIEDDYDSERGKVSISNQSFRNILDLFERYNFTVEESTPLNVQVAVDPEMLGKVFEELVTGRHESGSYYTPRQIVSFMCREALKHYLEKSASKEEAARFVDEGDASGLPNPENVLEALQRVRVCDPACGSGAYLLGMMQELVRLRSALFVSRNIGDESVYKIKRSIIENNLYGVDKDPFAVQIAALRLWLSLAIDSEKPQPLPNLDFKIGCGDSLLAPAPSANEKTLFFERQQKVSEYVELKNKFAGADGDQKRALREQIEGLRVEIATALKHSAPRPSEAKIEYHRRHVESLEKDVRKADREGNKARAVKLQKELQSLKRQLAAWDKAGEEKETGFDWAVEFAEVFMPKARETWRLDGQHPLLNNFKRQGTFIEEANPDAASGGFDIVLANPPYVRSEEIGDNKSKLVSLYSDVAAGKSDLSVYFYVRGLQILKEQGAHVFICTNSWLDVGYGGKLQKYILNNAYVDAIYDSAIERQFATASINTIISVLVKGKTKDDAESRFVTLLAPFIEAINNPIKSRTVIRSHKELWQAGSDNSGNYCGDKWGGKYLRAPKIYAVISVKADLVKLSSLCKVEGYIHDNNTGASFPSANFVKSIKDIDRIHLKKDSPCVSKYGVKASGNSRVKAPLLFPRTYGNRHIVVWNPDGVFGKEFYKIIPYDKRQEISIAAQINSTFGILQREILGLVNLGDGAIKFSGDDVEKFLILKTLTSDKVEKEFREMADRNALDIELEVQQKDRRKLDKIVFDALELSEKEREEVYEAVVGLVSRRTTKAKSV